MFEHFARIFVHLIARFNEPKHRQRNCRSPWRRAFACIEARDIGYQVTILPIKVVRSR